MTSNQRPGHPDGHRETQSALPRRRRHLMDPNAPWPVRDTTAEIRSLTRVQRWVASSLAVTTILHLSVGLVIAAMYLP